MTTDPEKKSDQDKDIANAEAFDNLSSLSLEPEEAPPPPKEKPPVDETPPPPPEPAVMDTVMLDSLRAENTRIKDQALRALAEAENTRRRAERDREDLSKYAISNFARGLLTVADNLRRAIDAIPADLRSNEGPITAVIAGIEATERDLLSAFDKVGIRKITAMDLPFNANQHEVMFESPGSGKPAGTVVQVVEDGYMIHDRLLRPSRVGVAKAEPGAPTTHTVDTQV